MMIFRLGSLGLPLAVITIVILGLAIGQLGKQRFSYWGQQVGQPLYWQGELVGLPKTQGRVQRVQLRLSCVGRTKLDCSLAKPGLLWPLYIQLAIPRSLGIRWQPGQRWGLVGSVEAQPVWQRSWGFNPQQWRLVNHLVAEVAISDAEQLWLQGQANFSWHRKRRAISDYLTALPAGAYSSRGAEAVVSALINGDRSALTDQHWDWFNRTGTSHLMAISGLHIGLVAGFAGWLAQRGFRRCTRLTQARPSRDYSLMVALLVALGYSAMAGFTLPTQRALLMLSCYGVCVFFGLVQTLWSAWLVALLLVVLWDPVAPLSMGFWLSFGAVATILWVVGGRPLTAGKSQPAMPWQQKWRQRSLQWGRVQWALFVALMPFLLWFTQMLSISALVTNLLAIPWATLVVVPLALVWLVAWWLLGSNPLLSGWVEGLLQLCLWSIDVMLMGLEWVAAMDWGVWFNQPQSVLVFALALVGVGWCLTPGLPGRWLAPLLLAPTVWLNATAPGVHLWSQWDSPRLLLHRPDQSWLITRSTWPEPLAEDVKALLRQLGLGFSWHHTKLQNSLALWGAQGWVVTRFDHPDGHRIDNVQFWDVCQGQEDSIESQGVRWQALRHPSFPRHCAVKLRLGSQQDASQWLLWPGSSILSDRYLLREFAGQLASDYIILSAATRSEIQQALRQRLVKPTRWFLVADTTAGTILAEQVDTVLAEQADTVRLDQGSYTMIEQQF